MVSSVASTQGSAGSIPLIAPIVVLEAELLEEQVPISNGAELEHGFGGRIRARSRLCVVV